MTTVDDILAARDSLRKRAAEAAARAKEIEEARRRDEEADLIADTLLWLRDTLKCSPAEVEDVQFVPGPKSSNGDQRQVVFEIDGVRLRTHYSTKVIANITSTMGENERVTERYLEVFYTSSGNSWKKIESLADLGAEL